MKSLFVPLELTTKARNLTFESELDPNIDILARQASYRAMGENSEAIRRHIKENPDVDGIVLGDEVRLRQIITNLASNACKFTPAGGKLIVRTKLVIPSLPDGFDPLCDFRDTSDSCSFDATKDDKVNEADLERQAEDVEKNPRPLSQGYLTQHTIEHGDKPREVPENLVIRIEVEDTGCGIKPRDIYVGKLFSDFNQTEQGRQQGGKGTGLGLALVRRIVKISGGRLGVRSKEGQGSTFWVELPVGVGKKTFVTDHLAASGESSTTSSSGMGLTQRPSKPRLRPQDTGCDILTVSDEPGTRGLGMKKVATPDAQTFAAMQGIMEQGTSLLSVSCLSSYLPYLSGGRVDLVLRQRSMSRHHDVALSSAKVVAPIPLPPHMMPTVVLSLPPYEDVEPGDAQVASQSELQRSTAKQHPLEPSISPESIAKSHSADSRPPLPHSIPSDPISFMSSVKTTPKQRPTFVRMPSPPTFEMSPSRPLPVEDPESSHSNNTTASDKSSSKLKLFDTSHAHNSPSSSFTGIEPGLPVLVVDDDPLTRTLMKRILTRLGCQVSTAENGEVALEQILGIKIKGSVTPSSFQSNTVPILEQAVGPPVFDEGKFAVIFLDNQMPLMSGLQVAEKMREYDRRDFIVGVTGNALLSDQEEYLAAGADRVLTKPVLEKSLRDILVIADERRKARLGSEPSAPTTTLS
jgi:osomolarity two-component system sensor histidine kinase SLN1